jgi:hypothetical protein
MVWPSLLIDLVGLAMWPGSTVVWGVGDGESSLEDRDYRYSSGRVTLLEDIYITPMV